MKIKVTLVTILLCFTLSFFAMEIFNTSLWVKMFARSANEVTFILNYSPEKTSVENLDILVKTAVENHVNIQSAFNSQGKYDVYALLEDPTFKLDPLPLLKTSPIDFSDPDAIGYYSSNSMDAASFGYLYNVSAYEYGVFQLHTFEPIMNGTKSVYGWYEVSGRNKMNVSAFISTLQQKLPGQLIVDQNPGSTSGSDTHTKTEIIYISLILFLLILLMEVSKNMKEISLRKSLGEPFYKILFSLFASFSLTVMISSLCSFTFSYLILIHTINRYTYVFIGQLFGLFVLLNLLSVALLGIIGTIIFFISPVSIIKNRNFNKALFNFNFVLKIIFIVFLFPQFLSNTQKAVDYTRQSIGLLRDAKTLQSVVYMSGINPGSADAGSDAGFSTIEKRVKAILIDRYSFYLDYSSRDVPPGMDQASDAFLSYAYLTADAKILNYYPITVNGVPLTVTADPIAVIPKSKKGHLGFSIMDVCKTCKIVFTDDSYSIPNFTSFYIRSTYENPIMIIYPTLNQIRDKVPNRMMIITKTTQEAKTMIAELKGLVNNDVVFTNNESVLKGVLSETLQYWYYVVIIFLQSFLILLLVILHGITVLYQLNKKEIAIHYFLGYSFIKRSAYIVLQDAAIFALLTFYLSTKGRSLIAAGSLALGVVLADYVLACIYLYFNEKKQALDALKNS